MKFSLSAIITRLSEAQEACARRRNALRLEVIPRSAPLLSTEAVLRLAVASRGLRVALTGESGLMLPHLDSVPEAPQQCQHFLSQVSMSSVRSVVLPADATSYLLANKIAGLISVEKLVMPRTCLEFNALSSLPSIRVLAVDCGDADKACVEELRVVLASLPKPLLQLRLESLERRLSASILETVTSRGLASRLVFRKCALPDSAVSHICQQSVPSGGVRLEKVSFDECELSDHAEQLLLMMLEQSDGRCVVTINGGMTALSDPCDDAHLPSEDEKLVSPVRDLQPEQADHGAGSSSQRPEEMALSEMLVLGLLRLQEERAVAEAMREATTHASEGWEPPRSRFGFALDHEEEML